VDLVDLVEATGCTTGSTSSTKSMPSTLFRATPLSGNPLTAHQVKFFTIALTSPPIHSK
jgi:hypothetical protein